MKYCSLEEAWGINTSSKGCNVHVQHKKNFDKDNPIHTPNINYECSFNQEPKSRNKETLSGYSGKTLTNYQPSDSKNYNLLDKKNHKDLDLSNFVRTLNIDEATKEILNNKISNAIKSVKYESFTDSDNGGGDIHESFSSRYYRPSGLENRNVDILFLILLGLFIIFILDKK
jgi:hypothetical protein